MTQMLEWIRCVTYYCLTRYNILSVNDDVIVSVWSWLIIVQPESVTYENKQDVAFEK